ncbi:Endo-1 4-beta-xylanase/feruloyl esterase [termite gut metagenome]|uniref:Endo-1 4-beta-xylanase/feruloyl esterase n=1 Tax=termite gut metagenome TaxID=433724 RepID=A0A5J4QMH9_9ZZZZ
MKALRLFYYMAVCLLVTTPSVYAQDAYPSNYDSYEKKVFVSLSGDTLRYRLLSPELKNESKQYPVIIFLHGSGERGTDNEKQLTHGGQMFLNPVNREQYPAFVISPQCSIKEYWGYSSRPVSLIPDNMAIEEATPLTKSLKELLDTFLAMPQVDKTRIYIMGLSMGGMGTFDMVCRYPELFAAAIPICGSVNPKRLVNAKGVSFRIFHGDADKTVPVEGSRTTYKTLKAHGIQAEYIEFPGYEHNSWTSAFNYPDFMEWLFSQKKK